MFGPLIEFVRDCFGGGAAVALHEPVFEGRERLYVLETIDSTFVSSVGAFVDRFEQEMATYTGSEGAVAVANGTAALHVSLLLAGVEAGDLVVTQPLTFVATCNAIAYCRAAPVFVDVDKTTLGMSPDALRAWLEGNAVVDEDNVCRLRSTGQIVRACLPMHTFGHPVRLDEILTICSEWNLSLVEDAAESLGSLYKGRHTGTFGVLGALSFNGNKIITTGGGGMILARKELARRAKHLTTTARCSSGYEYLHDETGYNYRMPNINAALGCAQLEQIESFVAAKRLLASRYASALRGSSLHFLEEPRDCRSNYWLNAVVCEDRAQRDALLRETNAAGVMTRPIWALMHSLPMYSGALRGEVGNAEWLADRVVNLPSSVVASCR